MFHRWIIFVCFSFVLLLPARIFPQTGKLSGYVLDYYSGKALPGTNIVIKEKNIGVAVDNNGFFILNQVPVGKNVVEISRIGFGSITQEIEIGNGQTVILNFRLKAEVVRFSEVLVTATRENALQNEVAVATEVISRLELQESHSQNIGEVLEFATGVFVKNYGHIGALKTASIRGASENQILILLDGQRLNLAQGTAPDLSDIPLQAIERVEIIRGGNSALYGTDAVGGVVNLITRSNTESKPLSGQVTTTAGSFGTRVLEANFGQKLNKFDYFLAHTYISSDGDFSIEDSQGSSVKRTNNELTLNDTFFKVRYTPNSASQISGFVQIHDADRGAPGPTSFPSETAIQKDKSWKYNLFYRQQFAARLGLKAQTYFYKFKQNFDDPNPAFPFSSEHKNDVLGFNFQSNWRASNSNEITGGYEFRQDKINSTDVALQKRSNHSVFLQDQIRSSLKQNFEITLVPALRWDKFSDLDEQISPKMGFSLRYLAGFQLNLRGNWGKSFRAPSFNDLYWPAGPFAVGNPDLKPEKGIGYDLGFLLNLKRTGYWAFEVNYFNSNLENLIIWGPDANFVFSPENVQEASIKGFESRLSYSDPNDIAHLNLDYTYLDAEDAVNNNQLIYRPKHQLKAELIVSIKQIRVKGGFRFLGKRFTNADNSSLLDSHSLVDIGAAWNQPFNVGNFKIKIAMRNIFDKQIKVIDGFPAPGRELRSSVGFTF